MARARYPPQRALASSTEWNERHLANGNVVAIGALEEGRTVLTSFTAKNYRGFRDLTVNGLTRINLIAGENNTGKTSLLEAVHLHSRFFELDSTLDVNGRRGLLVGHDELKTAWSLLFTDLETSSPFVLESSMSNGLHRTVDFYLTDIKTLDRDHPGLVQKLMGHLAPTIWSTDMPAFLVKYEDSEKELRTCIFINKFKGAIAGWSEVPSSPIASRFLSTGPIDQMAEIAEYSVIEIAGNQEDLVLPVLRIVQPDLRRITLAKLAGRDQFFADIGRRYLMPLTSMGEGVRRILSFVLAITKSAGGVVLIDEIENGLHHSIMEKVWRAIGEAARTANCQVFATTHSYECIEAAQRAFVDNGEDDLTFIRLERKGEEIVPIVVSEESLETAIGHNWEMR